MRLETTEVCFHRRIPKYYGRSYKQWIILTEIETKGTLRLSKRQIKFLRHIVRKEGLESLTSKWYRGKQRMTNLKSFDVKVGNGRNIKIYWNGLQMIESRGEPWTQECWMDTAHRKRRNWFNCSKHSLVWVKRCGTNE